MKLKTKFQDEDFELGEVVDATISTTSLVDTHIKLKAKAKRGGEHMFNFSRISELFELFEDYEEPKEYWYLSGSGEIRRTEDDGVKFDKYHKEIGNYFLSREEAEKAVEKLEALKRLRDKGFRFEGRYKPNYGEIFTIRCRLPKDTLVIDVAQDLDLLFGGEE